MKYMTNKDYNELLKENQHLKLKLEAAYTKIDRMDEVIDYITRLIASSYSEVKELHYPTNKANEELTEFSHGIDIEVESKINKLK